MTASSCVDRNTVIGEQINQYLQSKSEIEDHCIHLLFSANRWEARYYVYKKIDDVERVLSTIYIMAIQSSAIVILQVVLPSLQPRVWISSGVSLPTRVFLLLISFISWTLMKRSKCKEEALEVRDTKSHPSRET